MNEQIEQAATEDRKYIYTIKAKDFVKIGITSNIHKRFATLQTANPEKLELLRLVVGNKKLEKQIHDLFKTSRKNGEWFVYDEKLKLLLGAPISYESGAERGLYKNISEYLIYELESMWSGIERGLWNEIYLPHSAIAARKIQEVIEDSIHDDEGELIEDMSELTAWELYANCQYEYEKLVCHDF